MRPSTRPAGFRTAARSTGVAASGARCSIGRSFSSTHVTEKLLTYALGRGLESYDAPAVRAIVRDARATDYRFSSLMLGIVKSTPFQMRRSQ